MQVDYATREVYAECEAEADGETIILMTTARSYLVTCWRGEEHRWDRSFGKDIMGAIAEYNRWARVKEFVPNGFVEVSS